MKMQRKINFVLGFKVIYLLHVLLAFNCFLFRNKILDYTSVLVIALGFILLLQRVRNLKEIISYKFMWLFLLFLISYGLSTVLNWKYGFFGNIKGGIWLTLQLLLLYFMEPERYAGEYKYELKVLSWVTIIYTAVCSLLGMFMAFFSFGGRMDFKDGTGTFYGFVWGRLWGCYTDPNHGALVTVVGIFLAIYLLFNVRKKNVKILLIVTIFLNFLYLVFSDSRSAKISFTIGCIVLIYLGLKVKVKKFDVKKKIMQIVITLVASLCIYMSFSGVKEAYNYCISALGIGASQEEIDSGKSKKIGREQDIEGDYSNRRFDIWGSGVEIFKEKPVTGIGFRNIISYAETELPDTYIVNNDYGKFDSFHNVVIDVLVSQGVIGIVLLLGIGISVFVYSVKKMFFEQKYKPLECRILFTIVLVIVIDAMFISAIFYVNSPETFLFWSMLGYLICFLKGKRNEECTN